MTNPILLLAIAAGCARRPTSLKYFSPTSSTYHNPTDRPYRHLVNRGMWNGKTGCWREDIGGVPELLPFGTAPMVVMSDVNSNSSPFDWTRLTPPQEVQAEGWNNAGDSFSSPIEIISSPIQSFSSSCLSGATETDTGSFESLREAEYNYLQSLSAPFTNSIVEPGIPDKQNCRPYPKSCDENGHGLGYAFGFNYGYPSPPLQPAWLSDAESSPLRATSIPSPTPIQNITNTNANNERRGLNRQSVPTSLWLPSRDSPAPVFLTTENELTKTDPQLPPSPPSEHIHIKQEESEDEKYSPTSGYFYRYPTPVETDLSMSTSASSVSTEIETEREISVPSPTPVLNVTRKEWRAAARGFQASGSLWMDGEEFDTASSPSGGMPLHQTKSFGVDEMEGELREQEGKRSGYVTPPATAISISSTSSTSTSTSRDFQTARERYRTPPPSYSDHS
ncbi:hypothetical protein K402DRAFT_97020 [Aulographum hederae CBS 113979]|uniref:Uncharacterized protein n=1 Tax=Aulographum hederae CBS 113979 TaxID=1176131 RepID=A0A6G1GYV4_9PEZI|nr:hypothetical protein K402DRAFT_97020 [Aulographum hederae CBS 113979]